jgi:hypothetical protein
LVAGEPKCTSEKLYGRSSPYFLAHNLYFNLRLGTSGPSIYQLSSLTRIPGYRLANWLQVPGFHLEGLCQVLNPIFETWSQYDPGGRFGRRRYAFVSRLSRVFDSGCVVYNDDTGSQN